MYNKFKEERVRPSHQNDELDISYVFNKFGDSFLIIFNKIGYVIKVARRKILVLLLFALIGVGIGYAAYKTTKPYYTSSMTLVLADIRNQFVEDQLDKLSDMVGDNSFDAIADKLDISVVDAQQIKSMTFSNLDEERVSEDSLLTGSPFRIELQLYDSNLFDEMEPAVTNYLENNQYFAKQKRIKQRQIEGMISKLKVEIASMDSIKTQISSPRGPVNGFVYGEPLDPTNLYRESISMYEEQAELEAELEQLDNMQVVIGFSPQSKPTGPNLIKYLLIGGFLAFIIGLMIALKLESNKSKKLAL